ncbi:hypothetical protein MC378_13375 [Polaribacter sp. MSW13]|uniref:Uncharacterized protein n=1 Tax=Polaribacter marinus TaxID=2916838 RepID=A0A9X1VQ41_9FLAO|nr:hypothetical protein [Polaribacter marinus]MCI2230163.1 hypothetical protein [Polaribacter marinus]
MKKTILVLTLFYLNITNAQLKLAIKDAKTNETKINLVEYKYAMIHPKEMSGTYLLKKTSSFGSTNFNYEYEINLNADGTCKTRYYKSNMRVGPKNKTTKCKWGISIDSKTKKPKTKEKEGEVWYEIIIESTEGDKKLQYYDRTAYYDYVILNSNKKAELRLIFANEKDGRIKKQ